MIRACFALILTFTSITFAADLSAIKSEPNLERRSDRALDNADQAIETVHQAFKDGQTEKAKEALEEVRESVDLSYESLQQSGKSARRSPKHFKRAELRIRTILRHLSSVEHGVGIDDRPTVEAVAQHVQKVHDDLLSALLEKK
jgi:hypothetical protein